MSSAEDVRFGDFIYHSGMLLQCAREFKLWGPLPRWVGLFRRVAGRLPVRVNEGTLYYHDIAYWEEVELIDFTGAIPYDGRPW